MYLSVHSFISCFNSKVFHVAFDICMFSLVVSYLRLLSESIALRMLPKEKLLVTSRAHQKTGNEVRTVATA